mgnify:CR=1 FL=1
MKKTIALISVLAGMAAVFTGCSVDIQVDPEEINQVQILSDGQLIHIPSKEEFIKESERQKEEDDGLIDLNQATASELSSLPGIGENKANQIISFRDMNGSFSSKEDLMKVPGIKEGTYSKLEAYITVR